MLQASSWLDRSACSPAPWEELLSVREQFDILLSIILGHGGIIWQDSVAAVGKPEQSYTTWFLRKVTSRTTKEPPTTPTTNIKFAILIWNNRSLIRLYPSGLVLSPHIPSHITPQNIANIQSSVQFSKSDLRRQKTGQWWSLQFKLNIQWYEIL